MRIPGKRIKRTRLIQAEKYVVAVEVEMVIPDDDLSEPCYESETVQLLREIKEHAERGDLAWLTKQGKVYAAVSDPLADLEAEHHVEIEADELRRQALLIEADRYVADLIAEVGPPSAAQRTRAAALARRLARRSTRQVG